MMPRASEGVEVSPFRSVTRIEIVNTLPSDAARSQTNQGEIWLLAPVARKGFSAAAVSG